MMSHNVRDWEDQDETKEYGKRRSGANNLGTRPWIMQECHQSGFQWYWFVDVGASLDNIMEPRSEFPPALMASG